MPSVQKVEITVSESNAYATIIRSMLTAANACKRLKRDDILKEVLAIENVASAEFKKTVIG